MRERTWAHVHSWISQQRLTNRHSAAALKNATNINIRPLQNTENWFYVWDDPSVPHGLICQGVNTHREHDDLYCVCLIFQFMYLVWWSFMNYILHYLNIFSFINRIYSRHLKKKYKITPLWSIFRPFKTRLSLISLNLTEIQCIHKQYFGKVLWNDL